MEFITFCVVYFSDRLIFLGLLIWKYSSILFAQQSITIGVLFIVMLKTLSFYFRTISQPGVFVFIASNTCTNRMIVHRHNRGYFQNNMVQKTIYLRLWDRKYIKLLSHSMILLHQMRVKVMKIQVQLIWVSTHPTIQGIHTW